MLTTLAEIEHGQSNVFQNVINIFSRPDTLAHPDDLLRSLQSMSVVWSVIFLTAGLVCLLQGYRIYRTVTVILALAIGAFTGYWLGEKIHAEYIAAGCLGALLAIACFRMMKFAVAAMGGLAGAFMGANAWSAIARVVNDGSEAISNQQHYWVASIMGLLVGGMLAFILFKFSIVMFTSISGATIAVLGGVALLLEVDAFRSQVSSGISAHPAVIPLLVGVPAVIGFILQESQTNVLDAKPGGGALKPKPA